jgi:hypothetical protein
MALTITATAGSATANSFATEAEFIAYTATLTVVPSGTSVSGSTCTETEKKALISAFRVLNTFPWQAHRTDSTQAGAWPRLYVEDPDAPGVMDVTDIQELYFESDEVPLRVKYAQIELALAIVGGGTTDILAADPGAGVIEETVDVITTRWSAYARPEGFARYPQFLAYISPMLATTAGSLAVARS